MQGMLCDRQLETQKSENDPLVVAVVADKMENRSDSGIMTSTITDTSIVKIECDDVEEQPSVESNANSRCTSPDANRKYLCPICEMTSTSQHDFTLHIRSHNVDSQDLLEQQKTCICSICCKMLSSNASLDRHMLIHSGERPFSCKYCGDTFTTNGNMHRHMRTHSNRAENYESDGSTDSGASTGSSKNVIEFNNNKIRIRKRKTDNREYVYKRLRNDNNCQANYICPVCERDDFNSVYALEMHIEDNHFDYPTKCGICQKSFPNYKVLNEHKTVVHNDARNVVNSVVGFTDLTFVDFSSRKFPHIARYECEKNLHKVNTAGPRFQCGKCKRAFPCATSLEIHETNCCFTVGLDLSCPATSDVSEHCEQIKRTDFFTKLDLQNNQLPKMTTTTTTAATTSSSSSSSSSSSASSTKSVHPPDLADIQSIISIASDGGLLHHLHESSKDEASASASASCSRKTCLEEETQDVFAAEFRKMKLRGEFPCRLCTAVFPNLRALKGHNRTHLNGSTSGGMYRCNMCPHSSLDKAALIRHMRSHNGDRPYECSLCNYAFTTKANCERHLRNRHSKSTRDEVKKSIIYHPSEDPGNEEISKLLVKQEESKVVALNVQPDPVIKQEKIQANPPFSGGTSELKFSPKSDNTLKFSPKSDNTSTPFKPTVAIGKEFQDVVQPSENLDVVLDLSKKKSSVEKETVKTEEDPKVMEDTIKRQQAACRLKFDPTTFYSSQLAFYRNALPNIPSIPSLPSIPNMPPFPFAINPLLFDTFPTSLMEFDAQMSRDKLQRYHQLYANAGLNMSASAFAERLNAFQQQQQKEPPKPTFPSTIPNSTSTLSSTVERFTDTQLLTSPVKTERSPSSSGSVKMVIKNGVLMPKQKQRRYRTERPFSCEYCSARFTLRSNMERHIKQQHPQFWSQRQRSSYGSGSGGGGGRKSSNNAKSNSYCNLSIPTYEMTNSNKRADERDNVTPRHLNKYNSDEPSGTRIDRVPRGAIEEDDDVDRKLVIVEESKIKVEEGQDLVPVSRLLVDASQQPFKKYFKREVCEGASQGGLSEEDFEEEDEEEEGLIANSSTSDGNNSATDENRSECEVGESTNATPKKKSAYSLAPNRVSCPYCQRKFPWTSSLRRHVLTHTGQKPFKCSHCPLLFTTKSNCDRHLLRKHGNSAATLINSGESQTNNNNNSSNNNNYLMRNVPERPFKCSSCPSSTFSTFSNLKKHIDCKHATHSDDGYSQVSAGYEAGSSEDEKVNISTTDSGLDFTHSYMQQNCDLPFKCHLCEKSFMDRRSTLDHIKEKHTHEYELLMSKNAFDINATIPEESPAAAAATTTAAAHHEENDEASLSDVKGSKFPDYANRKVVCAFCMRRFWSAEDLRRHMRTHTGERPFSCDICLRRFTLKHSMLRHRKKHNVPFENVDNFANSDEEVILNSAQSQRSTAGKRECEEDLTEASDLISNLLGIRDRSIIDQVLTASADTAAKLLGVKNS